MMKMMKTKGEFEPSPASYPLREDLFNKSQSPPLANSKQQMGSQPVLEFGKLEKILSERRPHEQDTSIFFTVPASTRLTDKSSFKVVQNRNVTVSILSRQKTEFTADPKTHSAFEIKPLHEEPEEEARKFSLSKDKYKHDYESKPSQRSSNRIYSERSKYSFGQTQDLEETFKEQRPRVVSKRTDLKEGVNIEGTDDACPRENFSDIVDPVQDHLHTKKPPSQKGDFFLGEEVRLFMLSFANQITRLANWIFLVRYFVVRSFKGSCSYIFY